MVEPIFVLASSSPARRAILKNVGLEPIVQPSNFDEYIIQVSDPVSLATTLAQCKAEIIAKEYKGKPALVLGCDSLLWLNGRVWGKPESPDNAIARWQEMRGKQGELLTGHALVDTQTGTTLVRCGRTIVQFANATDAEIASYVATGEPLQVAGCFTLDRLGGWLVEKVEGCHTNVVGLSLPLLRVMLQELGYGIRFDGGRTRILSVKT
ncbi:MAG: Maf family protein [Pseudanabaenaceae cyanobacterium]